MRESIIDLVKTNYLPPGASDTASVERLDSGRLVWSQHTPDQELPGVVAEHLPFRRH
jgi:hypothetical protein